MPKYAASREKNTVRQKTVMSQDYEPPRASIGAKNMRDEETRPLITTQVFGSGTVLPKYAYDQTKKKYIFILFNRTLATTLNH